MRSYSLGYALVNVSGIARNLEIWENREGDMSTRKTDWSAASVSQGTQGVAQNLPKQKEARQDPPLVPAEGAQPCRHLEFELLASRTVLVFQATQFAVICCSSPNKLRHPPKNVVVHNPSKKGEVN